MLEKKSFEKSSKNVSLHSHEYRDQKMVKKTREIIFPETHEWCEKKCWKKIVGKKCEKRFFIFTRIS